MYKSVNPSLNPRIILLSNGINHDLNCHNDIEMIALHSLNYTSLKDLMPESPPSTALLTCCLGESWREIPIKDPLLQHAAWAYLQPMMMTVRQCENRRWWRRFHDRLCWLLSCFNDVVLVVFENWLPKHFRERLMIKIQSDEREC